MGNGSVMLVMILKGASLLAKNSFRLGSVASRVVGGRKIRVCQSGYLMSFKVRLLEEDKVQLTFSLVPLTGWIFSLGCSVPSHYARLPMEPSPVKSTQSEGLSRLPSRSGTAK